VGWNILTAAVGRMVTDFQLLIDCCWVRVAELEVIVVV
jgi:hypothetical protein